jgi:hypothetical protein
VKFGIGISKNVQVMVTFAFPAIFSPPSWICPFKKVLNFLRMSPNGFGFSRQKSIGDHHNTLYMSKNKVVWQIAPTTTNIACYIGDTFKAI